MTTTIDYTLNTKRRLSVMDAEIAKAQQIVNDCAGQMDKFLDTIAKVYDRPIDALHEAYNDPRTPSEQDRDTAAAEWGETYASLLP